MNLFYMFNESAAPQKCKPRVTGNLRQLRPCLNAKRKEMFRTPPRREKQLYGTDSGLDEMAGKVTPCLH